MVSFSCGLGDTHGWSFVGWHTAALKSSEQNIPCYMNSGTLTGTLAKLEAFFFGSGGRGRVFPDLMLGT